MNEFITQVGLKDLNRKPLRGFLLPVNLRLQSLNTKRSLLTGDAAGLIECLTGEGIYYAVLSGIIATQSIEHTYLDKNPDLDFYTQRIHQEIMPELIAAKDIHTFFNSFPLFCNHLIQRNKKIQWYMARFFKGKSTFYKLKNKYTLLRTMWPILILISRIFNLRNKLHLRFF